MKVIFDALERGWTIDHLAVANVKTSAFLSILLRNWICSIETFNDFLRNGSGMTDDVPYNYYEMSQVSVLAGAAWRAGYIALQEYDTTKRKGKKARGDLYICDEHYDYECEAKAIWIADSARWLGAVTDKCAEAIDAADALDSQKSKKLALTFVCLKRSVDSSPSARDARENIKRFAKSVIKTCVGAVPKKKAHIAKHIAMAWIFPPQDRLFEENGGKGRREPTFYPGCVLLIHSVRNLSKKRRRTKSK